MLDLTTCACVSAAETEDMFYYQDHTLHNSNTYLSYAILYPVLTATAPQNTGQS